MICGQLTFKRKTKLTHGIIHIVGNVFQLDSEFFLDNMLYIGGVVMDGLDFLKIIPTIQIQINGLDLEFIYILTRSIFFEFF